MARSQGFCPLTKFAAFLRCFHQGKLVASLGFSLSHLVLSLLSRTSPSPLVLRPKGWFSTSSAPFFFNSLPDLKSQRRSANSESPFNSCLWLGRSEDYPTGLSQTGPLTASPRSRMTTSDRLRTPRTSPTLTGRRCSIPRFETQPSTLHENKESRRIERHPERSLPRGPQAPKESGSSEEGPETNDNVDSSIWKDETSFSRRISHPAAPLCS